MASEAVEIYEELQVSEEVYNDSMDYIHLETRTCCIDFEPLDKSEATLFRFDCNHIFHMLCFKKYHKCINNRIPVPCPLCRRMTHMEDIMIILRIQNKKLVFYPYAFSGEKNELKMVRTILHLKKKGNIIDKN